jgi:A/G-specific adenine glycosylase
MQIIMSKSKFFVNTLVKWAQSFLLHYSWRNFDDPYKSLITEILLRKTNAEKVENILLSTLTNIPDIESLENISEDDLERILIPYGMSKIKARQLKIIASQIQSQYNGIIPCDEIELMNLYGVGRYISRALQCFAFNQSVGIVDTNVIRILTRYFNYSSDVSRKRDDKALWAFTDTLVPNENAKLFNYALLDYPKLVCKLKKPDCINCNLACLCSYKV